MDDYLYIGSCAGYLYAFDTQSGEIRWQFDTSEDGASQFHGNPLIRDSLIIIGTDESMNMIGTLYAVNRHSGTLIWKADGGSGMTTDIAGDMQSIYVIDRNDLVQAIDINTGETQWQYQVDWEHPGDAQYDRMIDIPRIVSSPVLINDHLYLAGRDSTIYCLSADGGEVIWDNRIDEVITTQPCRVEDRIAVGTGDYRLAYFSAEDGSIIDSDSLRLIPQQTMLYTDSILYFLGGLEDGKPSELVAIDPSVGNEKWHLSISAIDSEGFWYVPRIHRFDDVVIVGSNHGYLAVVGMSDGRQITSYNLTDPIRGIGHDRDILYVGTFPGLLYALRLGH